MSTYEERVEKICADLGIRNPPYEGEITVSAVSFFSDNVWKKIIGDKKNCLERLYLQRHLGHVVGQSYTDVAHPNLLKRSAASHFGDHWPNTGTADNALLVAFKAATEIRVHWKR